VIAADASTPLRLAAIKRRIHLHFHEIRFEWKYMRRGMLLRADDFKALHFQATTIQYGKKLYSAAFCLLLF
jgi:hypothetical protein